MENITFDYSNGFVKDHEIEYLKYSAYLAHELLHSRNGPGSEYIGWLDYPDTYDKVEFNRLKAVSSRIREHSDVFIVIGIGGSYLGSRACIEALSHSFYNLIDKSRRKCPQIYFVGNNMSSTYMEELLELVEDKEVSINVISKSGTTTEPAIAFRIFRDFMEKKYGENGSRERIFVTTDKSKGALRQLALEKGYETFTIPDDIGGRYSIFTSVGLLPIAVAGIDIEHLLSGALDGMKEYAVEDIDKNYCYQYAILRNVLHRKGKTIEILAVYEPRLFYLQEWWKQLFGESEGKDLKGIQPLSVSFTTDLHSLGQLIQDGRRNIFETTINIEKPRKDIEIKKEGRNIDGLDFLHGKTVDFLNKKAFEGTTMAHVSGEVPNLLINVPEMNEYYFGKLIYFFQKSCSISGYILGVNPFNQPGVEEYKKNMYKLIGK